MARKLLFYDGFALSPADSSKQLTKYGQNAGVFEIVTGRTPSTYGCGLTTGAFIQTRGLNPTAGKLVFFHFLTKFDRNTETRLNGTLCTLSEGISRNHVYFSMVDEFAHIAAYRGDGTLLGTTTQTLTSDRWWLIQGKIFVDDTAGTIDLRADGVSILSLAGLDTKNGGTGNWDRMALSGYLTGSNFAQFSDFIIWQGDAGDTWPSLALRVLTSHPKSGNGAHVDFTPLFGSDHGAMVKEVTPDDDTTYNFDKTPGDRDSYKYDPFEIPGFNVLAVQLDPYLKQTDAGVRTTKSFVRVGGTDYDHPDTLDPIPTGYEYRPQLWETDPSTGLAWTEATINDPTTEIGLKIVS